MYLITPLSSSQKKAQIAEKIPLKRYLLNCKLFDVTNCVMLTTFLQCRVYVVVLFLAFEINPDAYRSRMIGIVHISDPQMTQNSGLGY